MTLAAFFLIFIMILGIKGLEGRHRGDDCSNSVTMFW